MPSTQFRPSGRPISSILFMFALALAVGCGGDGDDNVNNEPSPRVWNEAFDASEAGWLLSVAGQSPTDVYAVGGTPDEGQIWHFDGASWAREELPDDTPLLNWVHVFDDGDVVVAGNDGTILRRTQGRAQEGWSVEETPTDEDLWGVWGASADDIWAVGGNGREGDEATVIRARGGQAWRAEELPELERPNVRAFFKVWGSGEDDVYIVGQRGAVLRWDGSELDELHVGTSDDLISVWGTSPDNVVMVGGRANGVVVRFDGAEWDVRSLAPTPGINGVWLADEETALIAGNAGTLGRLELSTLEFTSDEVATGLDLHAVFGVDDARFSVGGNFSVPQGPYEGAAVRLEESQ